MNPEYHEWARSIVARLTSEAARYGWTASGADRPVESGSCYVRFTKPSGARGFTVRVSNHKPYGVRAKYNILPGRESLIDDVTARFSQSAT